MSTPVSARPTWYSRSGPGARRRTPAPRAACPPETRGPSTEAHRERSRRVPPPAPPELPRGLAGDPGEGPAGRAPHAPVGAGDGALRRHDVRDLPLRPGPRVAQ